MSERIKSPMSYNFFQREFYGSGEVLLNIVTAQPNDAPILHKNHTPLTDEQRAGKWGASCAPAILDLLNKAKDNSTYTASATHRIINSLRASLEHKPPLY